MHVVGIGGLVEREGSLKLAHLALPGVLAAQEAAVCAAAVGQEGRLWQPLALARDCQLVGVLIDLDLLQEERG